MVFRAYCKKCKANVNQLWDANADRWKLEDHYEGDKLCRNSGASVVPSGAQVVT